MNREIKFRAWSKLNNEMWHNFLVDATGKNEIWLFTTGGLRLEANTATDSGNIELMQCTGLKDKNGVEIYEGDILRRYSYADWVVIWHEAGFYLQNINGLESGDKYPLTQDYCSGREIIGNLFESPSGVEEK